MKIIGAAPLTAFQLACSLPRNAKFRAFVASVRKCDAVTIDDAGQFIRERCEVESRRELETDYEAVYRFHSRVRKPFVAWCAQQAEHA